MLNTLLFIAVVFCAVIVSFSKTSTMSDLSVGDSSSEKEIADVIESFQCSFNNVTKVSPTNIMKFLFGTAMNIVLEFTLKSLKYTLFYCKKKWQEGWCDLNQRHVEGGNPSLQPSCKDS